VPDDKRGERLVVVYSNLGATPGQIVDRLKSSGICKLWIPQAADFIQVSELPVLRNGKLDLRGIHQIAAGENHGRMPRNS
jgi:acyl-[acyl-carrier-protein]-phospholipid O-acyltransferase/long-chain-fatty-acid--[acyl-carrier-protein] ligase